MKNICKKLIPLIFFSIISCYAQQSDKSLRLEILLNNPNLEEKFKKPDLNPTFNSNSINLKVEEAIGYMGLPILNETRWLLNFYYVALNNYQELKRFQNSFTSYELQINKEIKAKLYLANFRNFKNFNDYELILNFNINLF
ncbi:MAG: hypothetical protein AABW57_02305 [Nanoarchaeota archaeon]